MDRITDRTQRAIDRLISQWKEKETIEALIFSIVSDSQISEDTAIDCFTYRNILTATGYQLDLLGESLGIFRNLESDDDYRARILVINSSYNTSGTISEIVDIVSSLTNLKDVFLVESYPAAFQMFGTIPSGESLNISIESLLELIRRLKCAGIKFLGLSLDEEGFLPLAFAGYPGNSGGLSDLNNPEDSDGYLTELNI